MKSDVLMSIIKYLEYDIDFRYENYTKFKISFRNEMLKFAADFSKRLAIIELYEL